MSAKVGSINVKVVYNQDAASYREVLKKLKELSKVSSDVSKAMNSALKSTNTAIKSMNSTIGKSNSMLGKMSTNISKMNSSAIKSSTALSMSSSAIKSVSDNVKIGTGNILNMASVVKSFMGAFILNHLVRFGNSAIQLASDLEEVQNVVDTTFVSMSHEVDAFARSALESFGLSELAAKRYMGTLGAMIKSMGGTTEKAFEMSKGLTQLAGDIASFYNLSNDEAFEKIRSGISGETEPLKALGLNLSVANLEAFALSRGITKSFNAMTEMEKATLRYNYLLSVTADAQGDFARTGKGWANQTRLLAENFNTLKGIIGEGLIAALRPLVITLNTILVKLQAVATVFTNFIKKITGWKEEVSDNSSLGNLSDSTEDVEEGFNKIEDAAKKAKKQVASFDDVIMLSSTDDGDDDLGNNTGNDGFALDSYKPIENANKELDKTINKLEDFLKRAYDFTLDIGFDWGSIKESLNTILGNVWKTIKNVGVYSIELMVKFLKDNSIGEVITSIFKDLADLSNKIQGTVEGILKDILDIYFKQLQFAFDLISRLLEDLNIYAIIEHFTYAFKSLTGVISKILDVLYPALLSFYDAGLKPIVEWLGKTFITVLDWVTKEFNKWSDWFNENGDLIKEFFAYLGEVLGTVWMVLEPIADVLVDVVLVFFSVLLDIQRSIMEFILNNKELVTVLGLVAGALGAVWLVMNINPITVVIGVVLLLIGTFKKLYDECEGFRAFIDGVWTFIKDLMQSFVDFLSNTFNPAITFLSDLFNGEFKNINDVVKGYISAVQGFLGVLASYIKGAFVNSFKDGLDFIVSILNLFADNIANKIKTTIDNLKDICSYLKDVLGGNFKEAFTTMKDSILRNLQSVLDGVVNFVNFAIDNINRLLSKVSSVQIPSFGGFNISGNSSSGGIGVKPRSYAPMTSYDVALASGGVVTSPTKALIGEAGAEAVVPLQNSAFIDAFANIIADKMGGSGDIVIKVENLYGDDAYLSEFARKLKRVFKQEGIRLGT